MKKQTAYLQQKVNSYPKKYKAIIIPGNRKEAFLSSLPHIVYFGSLALIILYITRILDNPLCTTIFGINSVLVLIAIGLIGLPLGLIGLSLSDIKKGIEAFKTGYYPPLNSIQFKDTIAVKTTFSKIKGALIVLLPILMILSYLYFYMSFIKTSESNLVKIYKEKITEKCLPPSALSNNEYLNSSNTIKLSIDN